MKHLEPEFYRSRGRWRWQMRAATGHIIAHGSQGYRSRSGAWRGAFTAANRLALWGVRGRL